MIKLSADDVTMNAQASSKDEALLCVAQAFDRLNLVDESYLTALKEREAQSSTYLGAGLAIPHGTPAFKERIAKTGVAIVHFQEGVDWGDGKLVYVAVGIAAKSDEHLTILRKLTRALGDEQATLHTIKHATTPEQIIAALGDEPKSYELTFDSSLVVQGEFVDTEQMIVHAVSLLKNKGAIGSGFLAEVLKKPAIELTHHLYCVASCVAVNEPKVALVYGTVHKAPTKLAVIAHNNQTSAQISAVIDQLLSVAHIHDDKALMTALQLDKTQRYVVRQVYLPNQHGLHARPATLLSQLANRFHGEVLIGMNDDVVSAKSLSKLLSLGAEYGQSLQILVEPTDKADEFADEMVRAINEGLGENVVPITAPMTQANTTDDAPTPTNALVLHKPNYAIGASYGIAYAQSFVIKPTKFSYPRHANNPADEKQKLHQAIQSVQQDLQALIDNAKNIDIAQIFQAHKALLEDVAIMDEVLIKIHEGLSAPMAWHSQIERMVSHQLSLKNQLLAERAADLKDVGERVLAVLCGGSLPSAPDEPYILIKHDLLPSDVARLDNQVAGIITAVGGASSHSAIVARALGIPAIVGAGEAVLLVAQNTPILMNGQAGSFVVEPNEVDVAAAKDIHTRQKQLESLANSQKQLPAITQDGHRVEVAVNIGDVQNAQSAREQGAEGVGLLRTELVFMKHSQMPNIEAQVNDYKQVFDAMGELPVVVRTLDVGGDKPLPYLPMMGEDNPFLGVRGVRLTLREPTIFKEQLIALIESSQGKDLRIMFPMIARLEEWQQARALLGEVLALHPHERLQVGMMIEVPSAAILAEKFAPFVDFFSIGTNDLTQYTLAIDRGHPVLSKEADGLHPSVLHLINNTIKYAHKHGKWVGVCGELGADQAAVPILLGLGVDELSVSASQIALVKMQVRQLSYQACQTLALQALTCATADEVRALSVDSKLGEIHG